MLPYSRSKLAVVGIGSLEAAQEFADALELPRELIYADEFALAYQAIGTKNADFSRPLEDGPPLVPEIRRLREDIRAGAFLLSEKTWEAVQRRKGGRKVSAFGVDLPVLTTNDDLEAVKPGGGIYRPLQPEGERAVERSLVLGGALVFDGAKVLMAHMDGVAGAHVDLDWVRGAMEALPPGQPQKLLEEAKEDAAPAETA